MNQQRHPREDTLTDIFGTQEMRCPAPTEFIHKGKTAPEVAYQLVKDETYPHTQPRLNLATFVTTYMDDYATRLMNEAINVNYIDETEYPRVAVMCGRCLNIIANLWNSPEKAEWKTGALGIGSSEACMLGGVAAWLRWRARRKAAGKPFDKPNLVMSSAFQVVWEKFCQLWQIELRTVPLDEQHPTLDIDGWDSLFKLIIITVHAFGLYVAPEKIFTYGISNMNDDDIRFANEKERRFKLVAHVEKIAGNRLIMCVMPQLNARNKYIYSVEDEFNGVVIKGLFYAKQFMFGRGAGGYPTGSAVLSDITACLYDYKYEYKKRNDSQLPEFTNDHYFRVYYRYANDSDLALIPFESISEKYSSDSYKYVVGRASLGALHDVQEQLRRRNVFIAAYPND